MLAGTVNNFLQLPTVTNICTTDHSKFFLLFVDRIESISSEWIYLPRDDVEVKQTMDRYREVGLPGAIGSSMLYTSGGVVALLATLTGQRERKAFHPCHLSVSPIMIII